MQAAKLAQEKYVADAKGGRNSVRRFFRWTGDHSAVLVEWTGLLPNDKYFAIMCGGLTVILKVGIPNERESVKARRTDVSRLQLGGKSA